MDDNDPSDSGEDDRVHPLQGDVGEELHSLVNEILRSSLYSAVDDVLASHFKAPHVRDSLAAEFRSKIDAIVDDHIVADGLTADSTDDDRDLSVTEDTSTTTVETAMATLRSKLQSVTDGSSPGLRRGAAAAVKLSPSVVSSLSSFVRDEAKLAQAQHAAEMVLGRYLHPLVARHVVTLATTAARRATGPTAQPEERSDDSGVEDEKGRPE